ncbi:hydrolethalus syndrome protein 1 isoform X2 [Oryzias melastigma]|uniref:hydrolethalus syndrome protein 1 isoform X2 n=1 Tax=Oryzias melastigma TaxID=30732 RepID=UPI000CF7BB78|nr:hydrolethalus syndrome protein 1 isoform X2 [Oryzias melastigma]
MDHLDSSEEEILQPLADLGLEEVKNPSEETQTSPPSSAEEKVSEESFRSSEGFLQEEGEDEELLSTHTIGGSGSQQDSYARTSVAPKLRLLTRQQVEPGEDEDEDEDKADSSDSSDSRQRRFPKKKVLREPSLICDEQKADRQLERLADLFVPAGPCGRDLEAETDDLSPSPFSEETGSVSTSGIRPSTRTTTRTRSEGDPRHRSFVRPVRIEWTNDSDPVTLYYKYKRFWESFIRPWDRERRALRWEIQKQLVYQPPPPRRRRVFQSNPHVIAMEKKRSEIRREIRNRLASCHPPLKSSHWR